MLLLAPVPVCGGGFFLYEIGTPDVGLAAAGYAARAQDASTVFTNPAGMTRLNQSQLLVGVQPIYGHMVFQPNGNNTVAGTDGGNAIVPLPGSSAFYVYSLTKDLKVGIGMCAYFGGALEYNLNWAGRYFLQGATILGLSVLPAVAYRVNDWLSVGGGPNIMIGVLREKVGVNNLLPAFGDGKIEFRDYTVGIGGNIGLMIEPTSDTRFGITYLTPVSLDFSDTPKITGLAPGLMTVFKNRGLLTAKVDLNMTVPQALMFSVYHQVSAKLALMGNVGWQNWSQFGELGVGVDSADPKSLTADLKYQDTAHIAVGSQYRLSEPWTVSGGFAYDSSMVSNENRTVLAPVGDQYRFGAGTQYSWTKSLLMGFAYEFQWQGDLPIQQGTGPVRGTVAGKFSNVNVNFFSINLTWRP